MYLHKKRTTRKIPYFVAIFLLFHLASPRLHAEFWPEAYSTNFPLDMMARALDTDGDGMPDWWEVANGLSTSIVDSASNPDGDSFSNIEEYNGGLNPQVWEPPNLPRGYSSAFTLTMREVAADIDNDLMPDEWETANGLTVGVDDSAGDADGDGISNLEEYNGGWNPQIADNAELLRMESADTILDTGAYPLGWTVDTDGDGMPDWWEAKYGLDRLLDDSTNDLDGDGILNGIEYDIGMQPNVDDVWGSAWAASTNFLADMIGLVPDTDADGMPDWWEQLHGLNWTVYSRNTDTDGDGRTDIEEYNAGTDPNVNDWLGPRIVESLTYLLDTGGFDGGYSLDTDGDGMPDWWEIKYSLNLGLDDSGNNADGDALTNLEEYNAGSSPTSFDFLLLIDAEGNLFTLDTGGRQIDSDGDGIPDWWERIYCGNNTGINPNDDLDADGYSNLEEYIAHYVPINANSVFAMDSIESPAPGTNTGFVITWDTSPYRVYSVFSSTNLMLNWPTNPVYQVVGDGTPKSYTSNVDLANSYLRIGVRLAD